MVPAIRESFNRNFSREKYANLLSDLNHKFEGAIDFRIAETPIFIPKDFTGQMLDACHYILDFIDGPGFRALTQRAIPPEFHIPHENTYADCIVFDFGVCLNEKGTPEPRLIEMQGFPSLFGFQLYYTQILQKNFPIPQGYSNYLNGFTDQSYLDLLRRVILKDHPSENVILLEIKPDTQKTRIDFYCTADYLNIPVVCLTDLIAEGNHLYYIKEGKKILVKRIYNRIIFDELSALKESLGPTVDLTQPFEVDWIPHPHWFYRISKFTMPFLHHPLIPPTQFLNEINPFPDHLEEYVLKPLFSFAGQGVILDVTREDLQRIKDPQNWILMRKVRYADIIKTPDIPAKAEIRLFFFREQADQPYIAVNNLARLSKGKMIGVRYNKDKEWVGGSVCFFEQ